LLVAVMAVKRQRNPRGEGSRLKEEVLEAAMRLLDKIPATKLSLRMVATEAGVAPTSIYAHFPDAKAMITAVVEGCWAQLGVHMSEAAKNCDSKVAIDILKAQMAAYVAYAMEGSSRYQLLFAWHQILEDDESGSRGLVKFAYRNVLATMEKMVAEGIQLPADDNISSTMMVLSLAHGRIALALLSRQLPGNSTSSVQQFVSESIDQIFRV
jgi:AcrR family transcriptional regulator